jgi:PAS domain S-box-containing protein
MQKLQSRLSHITPQSSPTIPIQAETPQIQRILKSMAAALSATYRRERALFDHAADVICSFDRSARITRINAACRDAWGYEPSELIGKSYLSLVEPSQRLETVKKLLAGASGNDKFCFENDITRKDGSLVVVRWSAYWSTLDDRFFCVAHDITQQKHLDQVKAEFWSMISHDLRTPLCSLSSFLDRLSSGAYQDVPQPVSEAAMQGRRNVQRLIRLTEDLLQLERMESGCWPLELERINIADVIIDAICAIKQTSEMLRVPIDTKRVGSCTVLGDSRLLTQAVMNLLSNAIKVSPADSRVEVRTKRGADFVEVAVIDRGRGIPEYLHAAIFDRFKQVELKDSHRGSGLGLAIAKSIIEQHGGQIGVFSKPGIGSRFWFRIPATVPVHPQAPPEQHADPLLSNSIANVLAMLGS